MSRSTPPFPTTLRLSPHAPVPTQKQIHLSTKLFTPAPILRFTVGKFSQLPPAESPEVAFLGRSNVGKSSLLNALFPAAPHNFARVSSNPGHTKTLNGYTTPTRKFTIVDLPGYGYKGREEWGQEVFEYLRGRRELKKAYVLLDALHGPKESDIDMLSELAKTGLAHQIVLTKLDRAPATVWNEIGAALRHNPVRVAPHVSAVRVLPGKTKKESEDLRAGVWAPLRGQLALGCDETVVGISSLEHWGISALRCSILQACGAFRRFNSEESYLKGLEQIPIIGEPEESGEDSENLETGIRTKGVPDGTRFDDDNPMRGKVDGGKEMLRKKIYRW